MHPRASKKWQMGLSEALSPTGLSVKHLTVIILVLVHKCVFFIQRDPHPGQAQLPQVLNQRKNDVFQHCITKYHGDEYPKVSFKIFSFSTLEPVVKIFYYGGIIKSTWLTILSLQWTSSNCISWRHRSHAYSIVCNSNLGCIAKVLLQDEDWERLEQILWMGPNAYENIQLYAEFGAWVKKKKSKYIMTTVCV
jgi:hypothetical protein